jgi:hypothetical protein
MKLLFLFLLLPFTNILSQYKNTQDCSRFRNGRFSAHSELNNKTYKITRKDSLQIETEKETGYITEWKITWLDECEYHLLLIKDNYGLLKSGRLKTIPAFNYKIIFTTEDYYIFENRYDNTKPILTDTIWVIK